MKNNIIYFVLTLACIQLSCKKYLEIGPPKSSLVQETVFKNNSQATSALLGVYSVMNSSSSFASGGSLSMSSLVGLSSDEFIGYNSALIPFYENQLTPDFASLYYVYDSPYLTIYTTNAILEGLAASQGVTPPVKSQLEGEALFVRAFTYFYLVNLYGPVPLQLTTDYRITQVEPRSSVEKVFQSILSDLQKAEALLSDTYPTTERVRPNKSAVQALLARTYLYLQDWANAEKYSSIVLTKNSMYNLVNLDGVFLANSQEAIWQLYPTANSNARDGSTFILTSTPSFVSLRSSFALNGFELNDKRQTSWVKSFTNTTGTYYYPFKYKIQSSTTPTEYTTILRLAEQYLIRAEASGYYGHADPSNASY